MFNFRVLKNIILFKNLSLKLNSTLLITSNFKSNRFWKQVPSFIFKTEIPNLIVPGKKYLLTTWKNVLIFTKLKHKNCYYNKERLDFLTKFLNWKLKNIWFCELFLFFNLLYNGQKSRSI